MKSLKFKAAVFIFVFIIIVPLFAVKKPDKTLPAAAKAEEKVQAVYETVKLYLTKEEKTVELPLKDYLLGVLAAEIPPSFEGEAIKAQTVAAYTFYLYKKDENKKNGYDVSDDYTVFQGYKDINAAKEEWAEKAEEYYKRFENAVDSVLGEKLTYNGKTALTTYFALSPGKTESAKNAFGTDIPYLVPVDSIGDMLSENYLSGVTLPLSAAAELLASYNIENNPDMWFKNLTYSDSGFLLSADFGNITLSGNEIRKIFSLKSAAAEIVISDGNITFNVKGYGHGVGLSQNGAEYMAKQGADYEEILYHYYPGCKISR